MIRREEIEGSKYAYIYDKGLPDKDLEFYWYGFKDSITNAIELHQSNISKDIVNSILAKLDSVKNILNQLQKEEKYDMIHNVIEGIIVWIGKHLMIHYVNSYHFGIYITNVKRWCRWILKEKEGGKLSCDWMNTIDDDKDYFTVFFELKTHLLSKSKTKKNNEIEDTIIKLINKYNPGKASHNLSLLHTIMTYLVESDYLKPNLLETLDQVCPVIDYLKECHKIPVDLIIHKPYSIEKIIKKHSLKN
jgi:hypothetical protein